MNSLDRIEMFSEYQVRARRTQNPKLTPSEALQHALFGLSSETGEILGIYQKALQGHEIDQKKVLDEVGDLMWFVAELCDCLNVNMGVVARSNIKKLEGRYPDGFDPAKSVNRKE